MTPTTQERTARCERTITAYSDDDGYTNLVDLLADAFHWCHANGHSLTDAFEAALMHFEAEIGGEEVPDRLNHKATNEGSKPMTEPEIAQPDSRETDLRSATDEALDAFWQVIVQRYPDAKTGDLSPLTTIRLQQAAETAVAEWVWANVPSATDK